MMAPKRAAHSLATITFILLATSCGSSGSGSPADQPDASMGANGEGGDEGSSAQADAQEDARLDATVGDAQDSAVANEAGGGDGGGADDAAADAGADAGADTGADTDAGADTGADADAGAGADTGADTDTGAGADTDAGADADAGRDARPADGGCSSATDCPPHQACTAGTCGTSCSTVRPCNGGCCSGGTCSAGTSQVACGSTGSTCANCPVTGNGDLCFDGGGGGTCGCNTVVDCVSQTACSDSHVCVTTCDSAHPCRGGCCTAGGTCVLGSSNFDCGSTGGACTVCNGTPTPSCMLVSGAFGCH